MKEYFQTPSVFWNVWRFCYLKYEFNLLERFVLKYL